LAEVGDREFLAMPELDAPRLRWSQLQPPQWGQFGLTSPYNLRAGSEGAVVNDSEVPDLPRAYLVVFTDSEGMTQALLTLSEIDLVVVSRPDAQGKRASRAPDPGCGISRLLNPISARSGYRLSLS